jgi:hypothetical protein
MHTPLIGRAPRWAQNRSRFLDGWPSETAAECAITAATGARAAPAGLMFDAERPLLGRAGGDARGLRVVPGDLRPGALAPRADDVLGRAAKLRQNVSGAPAGRAGSGNGGVSFLGDRHPVSRYQ